MHIRKGGHVQAAAPGIKAIERFVKELELAIGEPDLRPRGFRAIFITLALENEASLKNVQFAAGHPRPETMLPEAQIKSG